MRNLNDFVRALGGIHNVLSGIAGKIDLIPVPGGGGETKEWIVPENYVSVSTTEVKLTVPEDVTELVLMGYSSTSAVTVAPIYVPLATLPTVFNASNCAFLRVADHDVGLYIYDNDGLCLKTSTGTLRFYPYYR